MAHKRGSERGVIQMASGLMLAAFGAMLGLAGCSTAAEPSENLGRVSQAAVQCVKGVDCGTGDDDCNTYTCVLGACTVGKPIKNPGDACLVPGKVNPPGRCAMDAAGKNFVCCAGCLDQPTRGEFVCNPIVNQDIKNCGSGGENCAACPGTNCAEPTSCEKGACVNTPVADDTACADKSGVCYKGTCCAGCIDANGACQPGNLATVCGVSVPGDKHATCQTCIDSNVCSTDICKEGTCVHGKVADNTPCADANGCDGAETCQGGACKEPVGFTCPTDGNVCHAPTCNNGTTCGQQLLDGTACPDANLCNGTETCKTGVCSGVGTPKNCDDKNPCTIDDCDPKTGACINTPQGGANCDDGNLCNGIGICDALGACVVNPSPSCDDGEICTTDSCDTTPVTGGCKHVNNTVACNDGDPCTTADACSGGSCKGGALKQCDDGNDCTTNTCKTGVGCQFAPQTGTTCNDGNECSTGDKCQAGVCTPTGGKICDPVANPCKKNKCDGTTGGECQLVNDDTAKCRTDLCHDYSQCSGGVCPVGTPINCDDANPCTTDSCDPESGCAHVANDKATCTDDDLCTDTACKNGKCVAIDAVCDPFDDCHLAGTCNPKSGFCDSPPAPSGTECDSGAGSCDTKGKCVPNPTNMGGAGGEGGSPDVGGTSGSSTGGTTTSDGGEPPVVGNGGNGNEPTTAGGDTGTTPNGGRAGKGNTGGNDVVGEGGAPETPRHVFVRDPGGCSCSVPSSQSSNVAWLGGLALLGTAGALARRRRARLDAAARSSRVS